MSLFDATQNRILHAGATARGHAVDKVQAVWGDPNVCCTRCGKTFTNICADAVTDTAAGKPIRLCEPKRTK